MYQEARRMRKIVVLWRLGVKRMRETKKGEGIVDSVDIFAENDVVVLVAIELRRPLSS
jgi:hypothetical protein